jgi:hypothetical protein
VVDARCCATVGVAKGAAQLSDARPLPRFGRVPDNPYLVSELDVVGRLKVPVGLPDFTPPYGELIAGGFSPVGLYLLCFSCA